MAINTKVFATSLVGLVIAVVLAVSVALPVLTASAYEIHGDEETNSSATAYYSDEPATLNFTTGKEYTINGTATTDVINAYVVSDKFLVTFIVGANSAATYLSPDGNATIRKMVVYEDYVNYFITTDLVTPITVPIEYIYYSADTGDYGTFSTFSANQNDRVIGLASSGDVVSLGETNEIVFSLSEATGITVTGFSNDDYVNTWTSPTVTLTGGESEVSITSIIAPLTYYDNPEGMNLSIRSLIEIVPLIIIVSLAIATVGTFLIRRD